MEAQFATLLKSLRPSAPLFHIAREMFMDAWKQRGAQAEAIQASLRKTIHDLDSQLEKLLDQMGEAEGRFVLKAFERRAEKLERERLLAQDRLDNSTPSQKSGEENLELALNFLANPLKLWENGNQAMRRLVLKLVFADRLEFCRNEGPRTPHLSLPFKALGALSGREVQYGAGGGTRTHTSLRKTDFRTTSAFAAGRGDPLPVRGLDYPFTLARFRRGPAL